MYELAQACGCSSDEEDEPAVSELRQINVGGDGKVLQLPDGINFNVLVFGRDEQAAARDDGARFVSVVLPEARPTGQKKISSLQAEISAGEEGVNFMSLGQTFNFVNELPLHAMAKKYPASSRIYNGDVLRFGGQRDGKPGGGLQEHVYRVNAPALGARPADVAAAATAVGAATAAAPAPVAQAPVPAASPAASPAAPQPHAWVAPWCASSDTASSPCGCWFMASSSEPSPTPPRSRKLKIAPGAAAAQTLESAARPSELLRSPAAAPPPPMIARRWLQRSRPPRSASGLQAGPAPPLHQR